MGGQAHRPDDADGAAERPEPAVGGLVLGVKAAQAGAVAALGLVVLTVVAACWAWRVADHRQMLARERTRAANRAALAAYQAAQAAYQRACALYALAVYCHRCDGVWVPGHGAFVPVGRCRPHSTTCLPRREARHGPTRRPTMKVAYCHRCKGQQAVR
jgi:hypothetical protein